MKKSKTFYHIHKNGVHDDKWQIGNILETMQNEFIKCSFDFAAYLDVYDQTSVPLINAIEHAQQIGDVLGQIKLLSIAKSFITEYQILVRELAFENIRKKEFKNLPSRYNCIYLCRMDQIKYWEKRLKLQNYTIYKIEIYDEPFKSRDILLPKPHESYNSICKKAKVYWQYNNTQNFEDDEYLYEGKFKILGNI